LKLSEVELHACRDSDDSICVGELVSKMVLTGHKLDRFRFVGPVETQLVKNTIKSVPSSHRHGLGSLSFSETSLTGTGELMDVVDFLAEDVLLKDHPSASTVIPFTELVFEGIVDYSKIKNLNSLVRGCSMSGVGLSLAGRFKKFQFRDLFYGHASEEVTLQPMDKKAVDYVSPDLVRLRSLKLRLVGQPVDKMTFKVHPGGVGPSETLELGGNWQAYLKDQDDIARFQAGLMLVKPPATTAPQVRIF
jgi:hypothetical protein